MAIHWNQIFKTTDEEKLGWFENDLAQTRRLLQKVPIFKDSSVFITGVGTSGIIELLIQSGAELFLNDLSDTALNKAKNLYSDTNQTIHWICQDISESLPFKTKFVDVWLDRAVLHFLTDEKAIAGYFANVRQCVKPGGYAVFAEFSKTGATRCAGLDINRYDLEALACRLPEFKLIHNETYVYNMPNGGDRPYIHAFFQRN